MSVSSADMAFISKTDIMVSVMISASSVGPIPVIGISVKSHQCAKPECDHS